MTTLQVEIEPKERPEPARESQWRWPRSPFPPIADYAFLSDCERSALVAPSGAIEWLCIPRHDSPSIFGALLDRDAGDFVLSPVGVQVPQQREYVPGTLVLETTWQSPTGWAVVCDALVLTPWRETGKRASRYRRTPPDIEAASMLVRTVRCVRGDVEMRLSCSPKFDYARAAATWSYDGPGYSMATADVLEDDGAERGILFTCIVGDLERQFEFVQTQWINDGTFIGTPDEHDPLVGSQLATGGQFTVPQMPIRRRLTRLSPFVVNRGGEYCFLPSLRALRWIADLKT